MQKSPLIHLLSLFCLASPVLYADQTPERFEKEVTETLALDYLLSFPDDYDADATRRWPLVIFLHGAGERGSDLSKVAVHGPPKRVAEGTDFPFILASPQCPENEWWTGQPVLELIDSLEEKHRVDSSRIYLTGLSMGGYGTWHFACEAPDRFAAIAPVCGGGVPYKMRWIKTLPVWAFHGEADHVVPLEESGRLVDTLKRLGNETVKFTIYPETGHDSWTPTYDNPELYSWLLSHQREESSAN